MLQNLEMTPESIVYFEGRFNSCYNLIKSGFVDLPLMYACWLQQKSMLASKIVLLICKKS